MRNGGAPLLKLLKLLNQTWRSLLRLNEPICPPNEPPASPAYKR